jgi:uncharacterized membrane protein
MTYPHFFNIAIHVIAGCIGIALGLLILMQSKGTAFHLRMGRWFLGASGVVCASATLGLILFRWMPLFAVLTLLVSYVSISGWRNVKRKALGPNGFDATLLTLAWLGALAILHALLHTPHSAPGAGTVRFASMGGVLFVLAYDSARQFFPTTWHAKLWRAEHIYRMLSALFGMAAAATGNLLQTLAAQLLPIGLGFFCIGYFWWQAWRNRGALEGAS